MVTVVIADPIHPDAQKLLEEHFDVVDKSKDKETLDDVLTEADALVVRSATKVRGQLLEQCSKLQIVGRPGVGLDNIDLDRCKERGIEVVNSPEGPTRSVAELAVGLMIAASRKFGKVISGTKAGTWPKKTKGMELHNKTLGIIGTGSIGGTFAKYAIALGMHVVGYDVIEYQEMKELNGFSYVDLDELFSRAHVISTHVPLLPATKHMIDTVAVEKMRDEVIIINTSRGGVIDENALLEGLKSGKIGGVALDVYEEEPVDASRDLINHELVVTTPHIGAQTPDASRKNSLVVAEKLISYLE